MAKIESVNTYCYDIVASKICKGVEKTLLSSKEGAGAITINNWSPNNIRRLVISADGILVQYYITAKNSKLIDIALFDKQDKLKECFTSDKYKPMVKALFDIRVCSCVEEIIYLTKPNKGGMGLPITELNITKYSNSCKRLHGRTVLPLSLKEFYTKYKDNLNKPDFHICDADVQGAKVELVVKDWWKYYPLRPVYYALDAEGCKLEKHFSKVKADIEKSKQDNQVKTVKKKVLGDLESKLEKADKRLEQCIKGVVKLTALIKKDDLIYPFAKDSNAEPTEMLSDLIVLLRQSTFTVGDLPNISSTSKKFLEKSNTPTVSVDKYDGTEADLYAQTIKSLTDITNIIYKYICNLALGLVTDIAVKLPVTLKYLLHGEDFSTIYAPKQCSFYAEKIKAFNGLEFTGKQFSPSLYNCLALCCLMCIVDGSKYNKTYWSKNLGGKE